MPNLIELTSADAPELAPYARLTEGQLRKRAEPEQGGIHCGEPQGDSARTGRRI